MSRIIIDRLWGEDKSIEWQRCPDIDLNLCHNDCTSLNFIKSILKGGLEELSKIKEDVNKTANNGASKIIIEGKNDKSNAKFKTGKIISVKTGKIISDDSKRLDYLKSIIDSYNKPDNKVTDFNLDPDQRSNQSKDQRSNQSKDQRSNQSKDQRSNQSKDQPNNWSKIIKGKKPNKLDELKINSNAINIDEQNDKLDMNRKYNKLNKISFDKAKSICNPYEAIGKFGYQNRSAVKMLEFCCMEPSILFSNIFSSINSSSIPDISSKTTPSSIAPSSIISMDPRINYSYTFVDICGGPGGFSECLLSLSNCNTLVIGLTLKNEIKNKGLSWNLDSLSPYLETDIIRDGIQSDRTIKTISDMEEIKEEIKCRKIKKHFIPYQDHETCDITDPLLLPSFKKFVLDKVSEFVIDEDVGDSGDIKDDKDCKSNVYDKKNIRIRDNNRSVNNKINQGENFITDIGSNTDDKDVDNKRTKIKLVTADGGISVDGDELNQELHHVHLILSEFIYGIELLPPDPDTYFICKIFDQRLHISLFLTFLTCHFFDYFACVKLSSSRPANSERYLIFKGRRNNIVVDEDDDDGDSNKRGKNKRDNIFKWMVNLWHMIGHNTKCKDIKDTIINVSKYIEKFEYILKQQESWNYLIDSQINSDLLQIHYLTIIHYILSLSINIKSISIVWPYYCCSDLNGDRKDSDRKDSDRKDSDKSTNDGTNSDIKDRNTRDEKDNRKNIDKVQYRNAKQICEDKFNYFNSFIASIADCDNIR